MTQIVTPYPDFPHNDTDDFDADPIRAQFAAIIQYLQAFPGDNIIAQSLVEAAFADAVNPRLRASEMMSNFVVTGGLSGGFSGLNYTVPTGTAYTSGYRHTITAQSFTATVSKDTYVYVSKTGIVQVSEVSNGAATPTLPADSQWLQKVISNGSAVTSIVDLRGTRAITPANIFKPYKFRAYRAAAAATTAGSFVKVAFDTKNYDTSNNFDITTNVGRFTAPVAGLYQFNAAIQLATSSSSAVLSLYKNGAEISRGGRGKGNADLLGLTVSDTIQLAATDYVEVFIFCSSTLSLDIPALTPQPANYFSGHMVGV